MTAGMLRLVPTDGRKPTAIPFKAEDVPAALRLRDRFAAEESVLSGRRRVEIVPAGGEGR